MYCDAACPEKNKCAAYQNYLTKIKSSEQTVLLSQRVMNS